jgi:hypothetical protein
MPAARPSFGDRFSYALARDKCEPLLYKGDDFGHRTSGRHEIAAVRKNVWIADRPIHGILTML